jgi:hypothetical protein
MTGARIARVGQQWMVICDLCPPNINKWTDAGTPAGRERLVGKWELHDVIRHGGRNQIVEVDAHGHH